tara:strand:+ start:869 stop:1087 length:219 start_codon:yes stop_codon:yes gene_type:complete
MVEAIRDLRHSKAERDTLKCCCSQFDLNYLLGKNTAASIIKYGQVRDKTKNSMAEVRGDVIYEGARQGRGKH